MRDISVESWSRFREIMGKYAGLRSERRNQWLFRGQSDSSWLLRPTLDRESTFWDDETRSQVVSSLLDEFRREAITLGQRWSKLPNSDGFELLARHFGLPSPLLDWTESPYVAAYFAFTGSRSSASEAVAVYALDRARLDDSQSAIEIIDDVQLLRFNRRALKQRSIFIRVSSTMRTVEDFLGKSLVRFLVPSSERRIALADLSEMMIDHTHLFSDADAAARTAASRVLDTE